MIRLSFSKHQKAFYICLAVVAMSVIGLMLLGHFGQQQPETTTPPASSDDDSPLVDLPPPAGSSELPDQTDPQGSRPAPPTSNSPESQPPDQTLEVQPEPSEPKPAPTRPDAEVDPPLPRPDPVNPKPAPADTATPRIDLDFDAASQSLGFGSTADDLNSDSWEYARSRQESCSGGSWQSLTLRPGVSGRRRLTAADNGYWFCFRVADTSGNVGFAAHQVRNIPSPLTPTRPDPNPPSQDDDTPPPPPADNTAPTINVAWDSNSRRLTLSSPDSDVDAGSWRYGQFRQQPACGPAIKPRLTSRPAANLQLQLTAADSRQWLCITVADDSGNDGFKQHQVATIAPPVTSEGPVSFQEAERDLARLLPWWSSQSTYGQQLAAYPIREVYMKDSGLGRQLTQAAWLRDGINLFEGDVVYGLQHLLDYDLSQTPRTNLAGQMLAASVRTPLRTSNIHAIKALGNIKFLNPGAFEQLIAQDWFSDGLTAEELAFILTLESNTSATNLYSDLLSRHYTKTKTINLANSGPTKIWVFYHRPFGPNEQMLSLVENALRASDRLFRADIGLTDIVVLLVDVDAYPGEAALVGVNFGDSMVVFRESPTAVIGWQHTTRHETAHFYFAGNLRSQDSLWLPEGGADFLSAYATKWAADGAWPQSMTPDPHGRVAYCETTYSVRKIVDLNLQTGGCDYIMGEYFLAHLFNTIGQTAFSSALGEMFNNYADFDYHSRPGVRPEGQTEEQIYRIFLKHTPTDKREAFGDLYRSIHGGSFVD